MEKNLIGELYSDGIETLNEKIGDDLPSPYPVLIFNLPPEESCRNGECQNRFTCGFYSPENGLIGLNDICYGFNGPDEFGLHEYVHKIEDHREMYEMLPKSRCTEMFFESLTNNLLEEIGIKTRSYPLETHIGKIALASNNLKPSDLFNDKSKIRVVYETFESIYKEFGKLTNFYKDEQIWKN
ncbi:MAG: hypothetical protein J7J38_03005 [Candidatus Aenigmarchaeota archaeon]|nr:hypothetical protein [Candidatus Aenigmarchaeota archaeon]